MIVFDNKAEAAELAELLNSNPDNGSYYIASMPNFDPAEWAVAIYGLQAEHAGYL